MKTKRKFKFKLPNKSRFTIVSSLPYLRLIYYAIVVNVLTIVGVLLLKTNIPPLIPLFYGLPEGSGQIGTSDELIIPSMVSLLIIMVNVSIASLLKNEFLKRSLIIVSLIITLLSVITTLEIVFLVGSF